MRAFVVLLAVPVAWMFSARVCADDAAEIRALVPAATAISQEDWNKMFPEDSNETADSATPPRASDFERSLTFKILNWRPALPRTKESRRDFDILGDSLSRSRLRQEIRRPATSWKAPSGRSPLTMFHADRITGLTCKVTGDTAEGTAHYKVPEMYQGQFDYVARRERGKWQITEISMPGNDIRLLRDPQGRWKDR